MTTRANIETVGGGAAGAAVGALTPEQVDIVQARARAVPPRWRSKFLTAVADRLASTESPTNHDILEICSAASRVLAIGIGPPSM